MRFKLTLAVVAAALGACSSHSASTSEENALNVYCWGGLIPPETIAGFERETGIKVQYDVFETDEILATKLFAGATGYDVVFPGDLFFEQELHAGAFRPLDESALPNAVNLDPELLRRLEAHDPGNRYGLPYMFETTALGYNVAQVQARLGAQEFDSWSLILDPQNARKLQDCGIALIDAPWDVVPSVLIYLGKDPNSRDPADLEAARRALMQIRPFVRLITTAGNIEGLANGDRCLVLGYSGDMVLAGYRARESGNGNQIHSFLPREGAPFSATMMAVPANALHPGNAMKWINYLMRPDVSARLTQTYKFPTGNQASLHLLDVELRDNRVIYPDVTAMSHLPLMLNISQRDARALTSLWSKFRTGH